MKKLLLFIVLLIYGMGLNAQIGDNAIINYNGYSLKYTVTSLTPPECNVICSTINTANAIIISSVVEIGDRYYSVTSIGEDAFKNCSSLTSIEMPNSITSIGNSAFNGCSSLPSIELPSGITSIGDYAFNGCSSLTSIDIPDGVTSISDYVFSGCSSLTSIDIPDGVTSIGNYAFNSCPSLASTDIPDGVIYIGNYAFNGCSSLASIDIPEGITSIGNYTFNGCSSLASIDIPDGVTSIGNYAFNGCSSLTVIEIPAGVTSIGKDALCCGSKYLNVKCFAQIPPSVYYDYSSSYPSGLCIQVPEQSLNLYKAHSWWNEYTIVKLQSHMVGDYVIVDYEGYSLKYTIVNLVNKECEVSCNSMSSSTVKEVIIPSAVTIDGSIFKVNCLVSGIFEGCSYLTSIDIPNSVTSIGEDAFKNCSSLTSIEMPNSITSIDNSVFSGCSSLTSIDIPDGVTYIGSYAFEGCSSLTNIEMPNGAISIGSYAFYGCSKLASIEMPNVVTYIGEYAFSQCSSLTNIEMPNGAISIGSYAFDGCSKLASIEIPNDVTSIGDYAFNRCSSLVNIDMPNSLNFIGNYAFNGCSKLASIEIPNNVTYIGSYAFNGCSNLSVIDCYAGNVPTTGTSAFYGCPYSMTIKVPIVSLSLYQSQSPWNSFTLTELCAADNIVIDYDGYSLRYIVTNVAPAECMVVCDAIKKAETITIPSTISIFGLNCSVTSIREGAFENCSSLISIDIPEGVTTIGDNVFYGCSSLTSIDIPNGVTAIGDYVFYGCSSLTNIEIPDGVTSIGAYAFYGCSFLTSIDMPNGVTSIGNYAFNNCYSLTSIEIPASMASIGFKGFYGCSKLINVKCYAQIPPAIRSETFEKCSYNLNVQVPEQSINLYKDHSLWGKYIIAKLQSHMVGDYIIVDYEGYSLKYTIIDLANNGCEVSCSSKPQSTVEELILPSVITIDGSVFNVNCIATSIFMNCSSLKSIDIPNSVTSIGQSAFYGCSSLTSMEIPYGVTSIGDMTFQDCSSLISVEIPNSVTSIGGSVFCDCPNLKTINCYAEIIPTVSYFSPFLGCSKDMIIYVPATSLSLYKSMQPWNEFTILPLSSYNITNTINPENSGKVVQTGSCGWVTLEAVPNEGYKFLNWKENGEVISTSVNYTLKLTCDKNFVANFEVLTYEVVASVNNDTFGTVAGSGTYNYGEEVTLIAAPNEYYKFVNWTENGEVVSTSAEYIFVVTGERNLVANFSLLDYDVIASVNPEDAGFVTGAGNYYLGDNVTLTAIPNEGYAFVNWTENGEVVSVSADYIFVVTGERNLVANFSLLDYDVIASVNPEYAGFVTGSGTYNYGEEVTLTAAPNEGYKFVNWTENGEVVSEESEYSFVVTSDRNFIANFSREDISLNVVATAIDYNTIKIEWNAVALAESYNVYRASSIRNSEYEFIANVKETSFTDTGLDANTKYFYSVTVVYPDGSESEKSETAEATTKPESMEELNLSFNIYPNPVNDKLYIVTDVDVEEVVVYDVYGRQQLAVNGQQVLSINVSNLDAGIYFVKIIANNGDVVKRFVKK